MLERTSARLAAKLPIKVVCYGDSICSVGFKPDWYGGATCAEKNWVQQLWAMLAAHYLGSRFAVEHFGIGGDNSYEGLGRRHWYYQMKANLTLIQFGANDCGYHPIPPESTELAISSMIEWAGDRDSDCIVVGCGGDNPLQPKMVHLNETNEALQRVAKTRNVPFVDIRTAILKATENGAKWMEYHNGPQDCHPNDQGMEVWAKAVFEEMKRVLK